MPYTIRAFACADCGRWTVRRRKSNDPWICEQCGIDRRTANLPMTARPVAFTVDSDGEVTST
jgi:ribosomal protein L37AE/L43A